MQRYSPSLVNDAPAGFLGTVLLLSDSVLKWVSVVAEGAALVFVFLLLAALTIIYLFYLVYWLITTITMTEGFCFLLGAIACCLTIFPALVAQFSKTELRSPASSLACETPIILGTPWWTVPFSVICAPGLFAALVAVGLFMQNTIMPWPGAVEQFIAGALSICPLLISYKLFIGLSSKYCAISISPTGLVTNQGANFSRTMSWANVSAVTMDKLDDVKDSHYHADDLQQQKLVFTSLTRYSISIALNTLSTRERERLALELKTHLPTRVFSESGINFIKQVLPEPANKIVDSNKSSSVTPSLTDMWQQDLKQHIGRTNYVPLEIDAELQDGRIQITDYLSSGGFSTTYIAKRMSNLENKKETVVIKESSLPHGLSQGARLKISDMFAREARLLQKCNHQRIAKVLDFFNENGREYLALEYLAGVRLSDVVRKETQSSERQCVSWALELAQLLDYLHTMAPPIIHRDFTPENLILHNSGHLYLIDFGAANEFLGGATGTLIGKQAYIAPEQFQGKATTQSDIYALGATLSFVLTAQEPLPLSPSHPRLVRPEISEELDQLIARCTEPDPLKRIGSSRELIATLSTFRERLVAGN